VPGLRKEEVAVLAGVSVPYYTRLERGNLNGVLESVLDALARALQLDERGASAAVRSRPRRPPDNPGASAATEQAGAAAQRAVDARLDERPRRSCATRAWTSSAAAGSLIDSLTGERREPAD
jgi:transcriptional regulator with XRE-family HTH domain